MSKADRFKLLGSLRRGTRGPSDRNSVRPGSAVLGQWLAVFGSGFTNDFAVWLGAIRGREIGWRAHLVHAAVAPCKRDAVQCDTVRFDA